MGNFICIYDKYKYYYCKNCKLYILKKKEKCKCNNYILYTD